MKTLSIVEGSKFAHFLSKSEFWSKKSFIKMLSKKEEINEYRDQAEGFHQMFNNFF